MTDDAVERAEQRRATEEQLIAERNAAQRNADEAQGEASKGEQPIILPGEDDATAVTNLHAEIDDPVAPDDED